MGARVVSLFAVVPLAALLSAAACAAPAGYVIDIELVAADATAGTSVIREQVEIPARLMMPLKAGDIVFVRDSASRITIETGNGEFLVVGGMLLRQEMQGEVGTGDSTWDILAALGGVLGDDSVQAPENMVAKGGSLKVPMAARGVNHLLRGQRQLWLGWEGGKAPYGIALVWKDGRMDLARSLEAAEASVDLPEQLPERFSIEIGDDEGQRVRIRVHLEDRLPEAPLGKAEGDASALAGLAMAAWLSGQDEGTWSLAAAQILAGEDNDAARSLLQRLKSGWRLP